MINHKTLTIFFMGAFVPATATLCHAGERSDIVNLIRSCPLNPDNCEPGLIVSGIKILGTYAKASVRSSQGPGETDTAYLQKQGGHWVLLDQGTGIDPEALGIPKKIW